MEQTLFLKLFIITEIPNKLRSQGKQRLTFEFTGNFNKFSYEFSKFYDAKSKVHLKMITLTLDSIAQWLTLWHLSKKNFDSNCLECNFSIIKLIEIIDSASNSLFLSRL